MVGTRTEVKMVSSESANFAGLSIVSDEKGVPISESAGINVQSQSIEYAEEENDPMFVASEERAKRIDRQIICGSMTAVLGLLVPVIYFFSKYSFYCDVYFKNLGDFAAEIGCIPGDMSRYVKSFDCTIYGADKEKIFSCDYQENLSNLFVNGTVTAYDQTDSAYKVISSQAAYGEVLVPALGAMLGCAIPVVAPVAKRWWNYCSEKVSSSCSTFFGSRRPSEELSEPLLELDPVVITSSPSAH